MEALRGDKKVGSGESAEPAVSLEQLQKGKSYGKMLFRKWTPEIGRKVQGQNHWYRREWQNYRHEGMGGIWEHFPQQTKNRT